MKHTSRGVFAALALCAVLAFTACTKSGSGLFYPKADPESDFEAQAIDGGKGVAILRYLGDKWEVVIPQTIKGIPVTVIAGIERGIEGAFMYKSLVKVTIPNSVTEIGAAAFAFNQLTSVTIGANVNVDRSFAHNDIDDYSFDNAYNNGGKLARTYTRPNTDSTMWTRAAAAPSGSGKTTRGAVYVRVITVSTLTIQPVTGRTA
jgi:hypothetical protein